MDDSEVETEGSLNTNAVGQTAATNSQADGRKRGRKPKSSSTSQSQSNTMLNYNFSSQKKKKRSRSSRRDSSDEELCEENKSQRLEPEKKKSPAKTEYRSKYRNMIDALAESGELSKKRAGEYKKLLELTNKQGELYNEVEKGLRNGDEIDFARFNVLVEMYDKVGNRSHKRLNSLADTADTECKAVTYESSSSATSSPDTTVDDDEKAGH